jgi:hypothetical protein
MLHVAPGGKDTSAGNPNAPLRSLAGARDRVRALRAASKFPAEGVVIEIGAGEYPLEAPLVLTQEDSGTAAGPVVWHGATKGGASILGSRRIATFVPITDEAVLKRLPEEARGHVVQADLKAIGVTDYGSPEGGGISLIFNGWPMTLSRWPNEGFTKIVEEAGSDKVDIRGTTGTKQGRWVYEGDRPARWVGEPDAWLEGYWFWDWSDQRHRVKVIDPAQHIIEVEPPYHGYGYRKGQWYYAYNLLAEIDQPGEWYVDRGAGILYFWPPSDPATGDARVTVLNELVTLDRVSHVEFSGLRFEGTRKQAIGVSGGEGVHVTDCAVVNIGGDAVVVRGGTGHTIERCEFDRLGGGAISLAGGDRATLTPAGHQALNNHIHDYGRWFRMYHSAISISGVGITVAHNHIHDAPHMAVYFDGNDFTIEYNEIHDVCLESNDAGAIYAGRDWTMRGTKIRYNYLYNITGFENKGCVGVYLDDMFCGTEISSNLFYRVTRAAFIGGGRDVIVENNVFVDCRPALHADNRAQGWAADTVPTTMMDRLNAMPYKNELWTKRYPELPKILDDDAPAPKGNVIARNVSIGGRWDEYSKDTGVYLKFEDNLVLGDEALPAIADPKHPKAAELVKGLASMKLPAGFKPLPTEKMGTDR